jgi:hypothetical protein
MPFIALLNEEARKQMAALRDRCSNRATDMARILNPN